MGTIADFYRRLGPEFADMKFKPTYNPYTEPSMEIFGSLALRELLSIPE